MKNQFIITLLLLVGNISFSQNIHLNESEISQMLCKTWALDYGLIDGNKIAGLERLNEKYIFKTDGTYKLYYSDSSQVAGKWNYDKNEKCIKMHSEKSSNVEIISFLSNDRIILVHKLREKVGGITLENAEFYFKPE